MNRKNPTIPVWTATRRKMIAGISIAIGGLAADNQVWGQSEQPAMQERPSTAANQARTSLHMDTDVKANPQRIYEALLDSKQFTAITHLPAQIDPKAGGAFSLFSGQIVGRNVELLPSQRIVQAWRPTHWDAGIYSIVHFELKPEGSGTTVVLDHTGFPKGDFDHLSWGWQAHYWDPLKKFFG